VPFRGNPIPHSYPRTAYELLFATAAMGGEEIAAGSAAGQQFRFVNLRDTVYDPVMKARLAQRFAAVTSDVVPLFGTLDWPLTVILGVNRGGGLEGTHAFSIISPWWADSNGVFDMVAAHELLHCWIGIRTGELDMPWWKEATTNYLGYLVSARQGLVSSGLLSWAMTVDLTDSADVRDYALSSSRVREYLYDSAQGMTNLVYTKGAQVCMLMDLRVRLASGGTTSLDRLVAQFCRAWDGRAFRLSDYRAYLEGQSGADLGPVFDRWVDQPGAIPQAVLTASFDSLRATGAFGTLSRARRAAPATAALARW
jgi:predicted metalloprotease with PDZ domain